MNYRVTVTGISTGNQETIAFQCSIEKETTPDVWEPVPGAPTEILIPTRALQRILVTDATDANKRSQLLATFRATVRKLPIFAADIVQDQLEALLPSGWPVTVNL